MKSLHKAALIGVALVLYSTAASADLTSSGMLDSVVTEFATRAKSWQTIVMNAAMFLFWTLGTISLVFTFGFMALRKADLGDFFAEFIRFSLFFGFFLWLLRNGPDFAHSIIESLTQIGETASGIAAATPSGIVDIGFLILKQAFSNTSFWEPVDSFIGVALSVGILLLLAVVAVNMLLLLASGWLLMYAGIFFLGFGGSRWTSDMAINYYKTVLGVGVQIMTMVLLVGIGNDLLSRFYARMTIGEKLNFEELGVMLVFCVALLMLVQRVPPLVASIITGSGIGNVGGIGNYGAGAVAGAAIGATSMAYTAAATGLASVGSGLASAGGGVQALIAAYQQANAAGSGGGASIAAIGGGGSSPYAPTAGSGGGGGSSPYAQAAGFGSSSGQMPSFGGGGGSGVASAGGSGGASAGGASAGGASAGGGGSSGGSSGGASAGDGGSGGPSTPASSGGAPTDGGGSGGASQAKAQGGAGGQQAAATGASGGAGKGGPSTPTTTLGYLVAGTATVAKEKAASLIGAAKARMAETTGGKIATAINKMGNNDTPTFTGNSLAGERQANPEAEVAAFVNRDRDSKSA